MEMEAVLLHNLWRGNLIPCSGRKRSVKLSSGPQPTGLRGIQRQQWRRRRSVQKIARCHGAEVINREDFCTSNTVLVKEEQALYGPELVGFAQRIATCNGGRARRSEFYPFVVGNDVVGYVHHHFAERLRKFSDVFSWHGWGSDVTADDDHNGANSSYHGGPYYVGLVPELSSPKDRTAAVQQALLALRDEGLIPGWRDELFPVIMAYGESPSLLMERAAVPLFGVKAYGVQVNGYVIVDGEKHLWIAKRSDTKPTYPGKLDQIVAGGQMDGISAKDSMIKECQEEAGIPLHLAEKAVAIGAVSYEVIYGEALKRDVLFCYDLELPADFEPVNYDGEVQSFSRQPVSKVVQILRDTEDYKPNCALVVVDFLIRHGYIRPEHRGYLSLLQSLRTGEL